MRGHGMNPAQVIPKCPQCQAPMRLVEGKRGLFWSCPNWSKTKCPGKNIDFFDINGNPMDSQIRAENTAEVSSGPDGSIPF